MTDPGFFLPSRQLTAIEIRDLTGAELGNPEHRVLMFAALHQPISRVRGCWFSSKAARTLL